MVLTGTLRSQAQDCCLLGRASHPRECPRQCLLWMGWQAEGVASVHGRESLSVGISRVRSTACSIHGFHEPSQQYSRDWDVVSKSKSNAFFIIIVTNIS